jgi:hypothetical protein
VRDTLPAADHTEEATELSYRAIGPVPGNHKEVHYHSNGTSQKIVWAWAGTATALFIAAMWFNVSSDRDGDRQQAETNRQVSEGLAGVRERLAGVEGRLVSLERAVDQQR